MFNPNFNIDLTQSPSEQQIKYLQYFPSYHKSRIVAALAGPEERIKSILLDLQINRPGRILTKEELTIAIKDCYKSICLDRMEWNYCRAIIGAVTDRAFTDTSWAREAAEQLIFLAARLIKGEDCGDHPNYESPGHLWAGVHQDFADGIGDLEEIGQGKGEFTYSDKARFALDKLSLLYPKQYAVAPMCGPPQDIPGTGNLREEFEQMWCHDNEKCRKCNCWDIDNGSCQGHEKGCALYSFQTPV